jgi:hypothetical protein
MDEAVCAADVPVIHLGPDLPVRRHPSHPEKVDAEGLMHMEAQGYPGN